MQTAELSANMALVTDASYRGDFVTVEFTARCIIGAMYNVGEKACFPWIPVGQLLCEGGTLDPDSDWAQRIRPVAKLIKRYTFEQYTAQSSIGQPSAAQTIDVSKLSPVAVAKIKAIIDGQKSAD
jgi:hypothetical protein